MISDLFTARSNCDPLQLYGEKIEKSVSQNVLKTNGWHLQRMIEVVKHFSYNQIIVTWVLSALSPGRYIYV